jgi:hypothetical protein
MELFHTGILGASLTKTSVMQIPNAFRHVIIAIVLSMNVYAIIQALNYQNTAGVFLALGSIVALVVCIRLMNKLKEVETADDEQLLH